MPQPIDINLTVVPEPLPDPRIIDGKLLADQVKEEVKAMIASANLHPNLAVILVGDDPASKLYIKMKESACLQVGITLHKYFMPANTPTSELEATIDFLNQDEEIDAILVQLPLPEGFDTDALISRIDPAKDVDGFHPANIQALRDGQPRLIPGLVLAVLKLLEATKEDLADKQALIIANSPVFTVPMETMLQPLCDQVTLTDPQAGDRERLCQEADIIITAVGQANFITADLVKPDAIIIDIGITKNETGQTCGDVDFSSVLDKVSHITPVPGGVGPMTVAMLLFNTVILAQK